MAASGTNPTGLTVDEITALMAGFNEQRAEDRTELVAAVERVLERVLRHQAQHDAPSPLSVPQPDAAQALIQLQYEVLGGLTGRRGFAPAIIPALRQRDMILLTNVSRLATFIRFHTNDGDIDVPLGDFEERPDDVLAFGVPADREVASFEAYDSGRRPVQLGGPIPAAPAAVPAKRT